VARVTPGTRFVSNAPRWWAVADRMRWTLDLFERLEQRERVQL
jgi:hypothetical protein